MKTIFLFFLILIFSNEASAKKPDLSVFDSETRAAIELQCGVAKMTGIKAWYICLQEKINEFNEYN